MKVVPKKKEDKKKIWLAVLGVIAAVLLYSNSGSSDSSSAPSSSGNKPAPSVVLPSPGTSGTAPRRGRTSSEWRPKLTSNRPEDRLDPTKIDPTLRLDLLAKVQNVAMEGGSRNLFQFGVAAPPVSTTPIKNPAIIPINHNPVPVVAPPTGPPPTPPPPPITLKYYGYTNSRGEARKKAFFLDGDDIIVAWEGDTIKSRYKVIHVGVNSVDVEDTQFKNKQTLPLVEEAAG